MHSSECHRYVHGRTFTWHVSFDFAEMAKRKRFFKANERMKKCYSKQAQDLCFTFDLSQCMMHFCPRCVTPYFRFHLTEKKERKEKANKEPHGKGQNKNMAVAIVTMATKASVITIHVHLIV